MQNTGVSCVRRMHGRATVTSERGSIPAQSQPDVSLEHCPVLCPSIVTQLGTDAVSEKVEQKANRVCCGSNRTKARLHAAATITAQECGL